ncbi:transglycosylase SLT domain-containing protein [Leptolyngbya sp. FACHB-36]|uniref:lytic transglycosylase domain-containing protein n=1 Tax=Leptolyngbya sp. FACHB-36 TaxID=2692808 RepID=UPI0016819859|nr:transglycosylase SLT domain-containing protein [Leptolyngbya sp. FACHB-36]MBD2021288.1 transglycosylase SLT domain-containing protein [Leptolyngbya sp. FACHB-36]
MQKQQRTKALAIGAGLCALVLGAGIPLAISGGLLKMLHEGSPTAGPLLSPDGPSVRGIETLKAMPTGKRTEKLKAIAKGHQESPERNRARYLLATDLLKQSQGKKALEQLQGLESSYPVLAAPILSKRAQAYEQVGDRDQAQATRQKLVQEHPKSPLAAEALVALDRTDSKYGDQAIAQFPAHPRTLDIVQKRLKQNPKQPELLRVVARHGLHLPGYMAMLDQLSTQHTAQLTAEDWEAIGFGYWEKQDYGRAGAAYARAPYTAQNAYRTARGLQLGEKGGAIQAYQRLVKDFPNAQEAGLGLLRLSRLSEPTIAMSYLDQLTHRFPVRAGEALLEKAKRLDAINSTQSATQVRQVLLSRFGKSDAAAELRWTLAQQSATAKDYQAAIQWAEPILSQNPESEVSPQAGFWVGKWQSQLGKSQEARTAFQRVLTQHPESYYAWRSASFLGWEVGDFANVRQFNPSVARPDGRPPLSAGSDTLKELYQLGQDADAWAMWQVEFQNRMQPTVAEQFTDGVMRLGVGDYLDGIFMVSFLKERETPEEQSQYRDLKKQIPYWQALYPFPFLESIETWSQERQLNPLLVTALIRQESRFMPGIRSSAGATGLMQVMPDTANWVAGKIKLKQFQLNDPEDNIKLGTWYLDYTHQEYGNNSLLAVASYNAGPGAVGGWVEKRGLGDPDAFVESIPYDETKGYVKSVFENYWNYLRLYNPDISQKVAQVSKEHPKDES